MLLNHFVTFNKPRYRKEKNYTLDVLLHTLEDLDLL